MKIYELPEMQIATFEIEDVITTSGDPEPSETEGYETPEL